MIVLKMEGVLNYPRLYLYKIRGRIGQCHVMLWLSSSSSPGFVFEVLFKIQIFIHLMEVWQCCMWENFKNLKDNFFAVQLNIWGVFNLSIRLNNSLVFQPCKDSIQDFW